MADNLSNQFDSTDELMTSQTMILAIIRNTGYSLGKIARETGVSKATIAALAKGTVRNPIYRTWNRLLHLYFASMESALS